MISPSPKGKKGVGKGNSQNHSRPKGLDGLLGTLVGPFWAHFGSFLGPLGAVLGLSWGALGALLGPSWRPWSLSWGNLGGHRSKKGWILLASPRRSLQTSLLGPSWGALGALLGALGAFLGPSWAPLGALLGHLGAILRPQEPIGSEKGRRPKTCFFRFWKDVGLSGASLGGSLAT